MKSSNAAQYEVSSPIIESVPEQTSLRTVVGMLIADPTHRRLIESASTHLELATEELDASELTVSQLIHFELIMVDEPLARKVKAVLATNEERADRINPAVVAIRRRDQETADTQRIHSVSPTQRGDQEFDAVLVLPMEPGPVMVQISLILYAQRAFVRRYHSALEELHLNRRIFRSVTSGISVANASLPDMPLVYVNPAFEVMTGYSLEEVQGGIAAFCSPRRRTSRV